MFNKKSSRNLILVGLLFLTAIFFVGVPVFPVTVKEDYEASVPYTVEESYIDTEKKSQVLLNQTTWSSIKSKEHQVIEKVIEEGTQITFSFQATTYCCIETNLDVYIFNAEQYQMWNTVGGDDVLEKVSDTNGTLTHTCLVKDTHYFVISNNHRYSVYLNSTIITLQWSESVTKYRTVTEYRTETQYRDVTKKVTFVTLLLKTY
jgi:hypothetical protein